jgi:hypothetical protein
MSLDVDQRDHVGRVFRDNFEQLLTFLGLLVNPINVKLLVTHEDGQSAECDPIPLRHHCNEAIGNSW